TNQGMRLDLRALRPAPSAVALRSQVTYLHLAAEGGVSLEPARLQGLLPLPGVQELSYVAEQPSYGGSFRVRPGAGPAARVLMFADVQDRQLLFTATIDYQ